MSNLQSYFYVNIYQQLISIKGRVSAKLWAARQRFTVGNVSAHS